MKAEEKLALLKRNTQEIIKEEELLDLIRKKKNPVIYLGTAITGRPHIGYFVWVLKMADFIKAGFTVKVLLADIHGALDNCPWEVLEKRYHYYEAIIPLMFTAVGADLKKVQLVKGSSFQLEKPYILDLLKLTTFTTIHDAKKAGSEVVKFGDNPKLSGLLYPLMQALDEVYLNADVQYGGGDQRKNLMFARENLPKLNYPPREEEMTPMLPGLIGKKMSASDPKSKIDLLDDEKTVQKKIQSAYCEEGNIEENGVLAFLKNVILTLKKDAGEKFIIERPEKFGGNIEFSTYEEVERAFISKKLHPLDLKIGLAKEINKLLTPLQKNKIKLEKIAQDAY